MARPLTDTAVRATKPRDKPFKVFDAGGLFLLVNPSSTRQWRFKYRFEGREKLLSFGSYPDVSIAMARDRRDAARRQLAEGSDPSARRKAEKRALADTFEAVAREWLEQQRKKLSPRTFDKQLGRFEDLLFPYIGRRPIRSITSADLLDALRRVEKRGHHETAHRARSAAGNVFRYAVVTGRADRDISADLRGALAPVVTRNRSAITDPARIGELMRRIEAYRGQQTTEAALKLAPLLFVRPGELRAAEWREINLDATNAEWRIPASRMKMREEHLVPLATQAVAILKDLQPLTGGGRYVFPSIRGGHRPISENTVNVALQAMGYSGEEMTGHGFRAMASTMLNERGFAPDVIELQLAHAERNEVRAAYNRAKRLDERRKMMQAWADYLYTLRDSPAAPTSDQRSTPPPPATLTAA